MKISRLFGEHLHGLGSVNRQSSELPGTLRQARSTNADQAVQHYRPEIDGLRALAVIAVLINHLDATWLPGGYLGVDLFFVISGYVVTGSLLGRSMEGARSFLLDFYRRRFRRLMPALIANIVLVAIFFVALVHPLDGVVKPALRSGMAALLGISNLYLLRQGNNYFAADNHFNPFLHTWSLGVEEQFYLIWPVVLLLCAIGRPPAAGLRGRLLGFLVAAGFASLVLMYWLSLRGEDMASFFLMPARFWELAVGAIVLLLRSSLQTYSEGLIRHPLLQGSMLLALVVVFTLPESWRLPATVACVLISAALLGVLTDRTGPGRWLANRIPLAIGRGSYSLYLWHWPVIVLAKWTIGLNRFTLFPVIGLIALLSWLSYLLESHFRHPRVRALSWRPLTVYPLLSLAAMGVLAMLQGPAQGRLFLGNRRTLNVDLANSRLIPGTTINTVNCFRNPLSPLTDPSQSGLCLEKRFPGGPTLFFEGDSHTEVLIPLGDILLKNGFNVAFSARGGCPAPYFEPRANSSHLLPRYQLCEPDVTARLQRVLQQITPGDSLVLPINLPLYLSESGGRIAAPVLAAHQRSIRELAGKLEDRGASLILIAPLPSYPQRSALSVPASLCLPEWYRPARLPLQACMPMLVDRQSELRRLASLKTYLLSLETQIPNLRVFDPFPVICPAHQSNCSTHRGAVMLFTDSNHLSREGVRLLEPSFLAFIAHASPASPTKPANPGHEPAAGSF